MGRANYGIANRAFFGGTQTLVFEPFLNDCVRPADFLVIAAQISARKLEIFGSGGYHTQGELKPWAEPIRNQTRAGKTISAYFKNDAHVRAPANAKLLAKSVQLLAPE